MTTTYADPVATTTAQWLLCCHECGYTEEKQLEELLRYAEAGTEWPRCCREVMTLYRPGVVPPTR